MLHFEWHNADPKPPAEAPSSAAEVSVTTTSDEGSSSIGASMTVAATEAVIAVSAGNDVPDLATTSEAVVVGTVRNIPTSAVKVVPSAIAGTTAPSAGTSTVLVANPTPSAVPGANTSATASGTVSVAVSVARTAVAGVTTSALPGAGSIVSVGVTPVVTVAAMAAAPTVLTAVSSASLTEGRDARIVRFNNRDLENLRKIQDELNVRKAGGALPRSPGSPIVIKAEITSPHRIATVSTMTQASSSSTATRVLGPHLLGFLASWCCQGGRASCTLLLTFFEGCLNKLNNHIL